MINKYFSIIILSFSLFFVDKKCAFAQDHIIELTGQVFFTGSDEPVNAVEVSVEGTNRSVFTNENGNFSIVVKPNEKVLFSGLGLLDSYYKVPADLDVKYHVIKQNIDIDTTQYKEVVINRYLTKEEFDFLMKYGYIPDANLIASRNNINGNNLQSFIDRAPRAYYENQMMMQQSIYKNHGQMYGQQTMNGGINPFAWYDFFKNWKNNIRKSEK